MDFVEWSPNSVAFNFAGSRKAIFRSDTDNIVEVQGTNASTKAHIRNLEDPVDNTDAATKFYVDTQGGGVPPDNSISTAKLQNGAVTHAKLGVDSVRAVNILAGTIANSKLVFDQIEVFAGDGLSGGGLTSLGSLVALNVDSTVLRTNSTTQSKSGILQITNTTNSTNTTTGSLVLSGGLGVSMDAYFGGRVTATDFAAVSDRRLKHSIKPIFGQCLGKLQPIEPYSFRLKNDSTLRTRYGVIAQECIENGLENLTVPLGEKHIAVEYNSIVGLLLGAVKELNQKVEILEKQIQKQL